MNRAIVIALALAVAASGSAQPPVAPAPRPAGGEVSLLAIQGEVDQRGTVSRCRSLRVRFRDGVAQRPETIWVGAYATIGSEPFGLVKGRYIVSSTGGVLDVAAGRVVHKVPFGYQCRIQGNQVVYQEDVGGGHSRRVAFDLVTHNVEQVAGFGNEDEDFGREDVSPDRRKAVVMPWRGQLTLYEVGKKPRSLGKGFEAEFRPVGGPNLWWHPVLWLDDDRILTQVSNGELVIVKLHGTRTPVVRFPVEKQLQVPPSFSRDPAGRIIYKCGREHFAIEVATGKWERREWADLGHGFDRSYRESQGGYTLRYKERVIGRTRSADIATCEGHLAAELEELGWPLDDGSQEVWVWSVATGRWSRSGIWANHLVGWMK
jgi:hypothetical protein